MILLTLLYCVSGLPLEVPPSLTTIHIQSDKKVTISVRNKDECLVLPPCSCLFTTPLHFSFTTYRDTATLSNNMKLIKQEEPEQTQYSSLNPVDIVVPVNETADCNIFRSERKGPSPPCADGQCPFLVKWPSLFRVEPAVVEPLIERVKEASRIRR